MARLSIELPDGLRAKAEARAAEAGCSSLEQHVAALIQADAEPDSGEGAPEQVQFRSQDELEAKLLDRLGDTSDDVEATPEGVSSRPDGSALPLPNTKKRFPAGMSTRPPGRG
jgi:hypothetical protein